MWTIVLVFAVLFAIGIPVLDWVVAESIRIQKRQERRERFRR